MPTLADPPICVNVGWSAIKTLTAQIKADLCAGCVVRAGMATTTWRAAPGDKRGGVRDVEACQPGQVSKMTVSVITSLPVTRM